MTTTEQKSLLEKVRDATWHRHLSFETLPFIVALSAGTLPLECYLAQLRGMAVILATFERCLNDSPCSVVARLRPLLLSRYEMVCRDLAFYAPRFVPDLLPAVRIAIATATEIRVNAISCPDKFLGFLYVLEGTTRGNQVHLPDIIRCFGNTGNEGVVFYHGYGDATASHWEELRTVMNAAADEIDDSAFLAGAVQMYDAMEEFHTVLYPLPEKVRGFTATSLNPEAGDHPVSQDPDVLAAALRAGERCRREFSYYERRYGERGRRFTASDVAWLAALAHQPAAIIADQVLWLGRVLAARGMPLLLMERQLELLVEEVAMLVPTSALQGVLERMRTERDQLITPPVFDQACREVATALESFRVDFKDLPVIIVAAWYDGLCGIPECVDSLNDWLHDSAILTEKQVAAIREILKCLPV